MKKPLLFAIMIALFTTIGVVASHHSTTEVVHSFTTEEMNDYKTVLTEYSEISTLEIVQQAEEKFLRVTGTNQQGELMVNTYQMNGECGECEIRTRNGWEPGVKVGQNCWLWFNHNPMPF
ncbi:MAG: hypothetical protein ACFB10_26540 [Salibacteraceae bacterium]